MFRCVLTASLLALSCLALAIDHTSDDDAELEHFYINILDPECNKNFRITLKDFSSVENKDLQSLFEGRKGDYLFCVSKKYGMVNEDGSFRKNDLMLDTEYLTPKVRNILNNCSDHKGNTPIETFKLWNFCAMEKVIEYRKEIEKKYYYKIAKPRYQIVNEQLLQLVPECSKEKGPTVMASIAMMNLCALKKIYEEEHLGNSKDYYKVLEEPLDEDLIVPSQDQEDSNVLVDIVTLPPDN